MVGFLLGNRKFPIFGLTVRCVLCESAFIFWNCFFLQISPLRRFQLGSPGSSQNMPVSNRRWSNGWANWKRRRQLTMIPRRSESADDGTEEKIVSCRLPKRKISQLLKVFSYKGSQQVMTTRHSSQKNDHDDADGGTEENKTRQTRNTNIIFEIFTDN